MYLNSMALTIHIYLYREEQRSIDDLKSDFDDTVKIMQE